MIETLLEGAYSGVVLHHVRMAFSRELSEVGRIRVGKVGHLLGLIWRIAAARITFQADVLYYPPAGPDLAPILRDVILLLATRWMFRYTIFHFHAAGVATKVAGLPIPFLWLARRAYDHPHISIRQSRLAPDDPAALKSEYSLIVPYGINDPAVGRRRDSFASPSRPMILYMGVVRESKGVLVLLQACRELLSAGLDFEVEIVGKIESASFRRTMEAAIERFGLAGRLHMRGVLTGNDKWSAFERASIFAFPTFFESESFGVVILEAMAFRLPVVATNWRAIPSIVVDGETGYVVPIRDPGVLADRLHRLLSSSRIRQDFGERAREVFETTYTVSLFYAGIQNAFDLLARLDAKCSSSSRS